MDHLIARRYVTVGLPVLLIVVVNILLTLHYAPLGFMPLDQAIIPGLGYRIVSGQIPFTDFTAPNGLLPAYVQAMFFFFLGVNYNAVLAHVAVVSAITCCACYFIFLEPLGEIKALIFSILISLFLFVQIGSPYYDNYALTFCFFSIVMFARAIATGKDLFWILSAVFSAVALFSKQNPSFFVIAAFAAISIGAAIMRKISLRGPLIAASALLVIGLIPALLLYTTKPIFDPWVFMIDVPAEVGASRLAGLSSARILYFLSANEIGIALLVIMVGLSAASLRRSPLHEEIGEYLLITALCIAAWIFFVLTTNNQMENGLFLAVAAQGFAFAACLQVLRQSQLMGLFASILGSYVMSGIIINNTRLINDMMFDPKNVVEQAAAIEPKLGELVWFVPPQSPGEQSLETSHKFLDYVRSRGKRFMYVGDNTTVYWLSGLLPADPFPFYHEGLSYPARNSIYRQAFENSFSSAMVKNHISLIAVDGPITWMGTTAYDFPGVRRCLGSAKSILTFGKIAVFEVDPNCWSTS